MRRREFILSTAAVSAFAKPGWVTLFDGKSLKGWKQEGKAAWSVEGGAIVGRQGAGGAAGDLYTEKQWANFEVECEWAVKWPANSGIWFRYSNPKSAYQADILDQSSHPGVLSGSLYCMGKAFIAENRDVSSVKRDGWNKMRIRAEGDHITIEQNGKKVVDIRDKTFPGPGSIGIQLHAGKAFEGMIARVRRIRVRSLD